MTLDQNKTKHHLIDELKEARKHISQLEEKLLSQMRNKGPESVNSEELFKSIYENSPIGIEIYDHQGHLLQANKACLDIFGISDVYEIIGFKLFDDPNLSYDHKKRIKRGETVRYETPFDFDKVKKDRLYYTKKSGFIYIDVLIIPLRTFRSNYSHGYLVQIQEITKRKLAEEELRRKNEEKSLLLESIPTQLWYMTDPETYGAVNQAHAEFLGLPKESIENKKLKDLLSNELAKRWIKLNKQVFNEKSTTYSEEWISDAKDEHRLIDIIMIPKIDENNQVEYVVCVGSDITERKKAEVKLSALFDIGPDPVYIVNEKGKIVEVNKALCEKTGYDREEIIGKTGAELVFLEEESKKKVMEGFRRRTRGEKIPPELELPYTIQVKTKKGQKRYGQLNISILKKDNKPIGGVGIVRDITEQRNAEKKLREMSLYDTLTGLYSRNFFEEEMKRLEDGRYCPLGIIVCDIDGLKLINDTFGHDKGDELLKAASNIIRNSFRTSDILARIGGDEFAVLMPRCSEEVIKKCRDRIRKRVEYYNKRGPKFVLSISIGYSVRYKPPVDMKKLFKKADDSMYKQKIQQSCSSRSKTVQALIKTMEARDYYTEGHAERLQSYALILGKSLGLSEEGLNDLQLLGRFHDLGKVGIPDKILFKPGVLSEEEFQEMKRHSEIGHRIALSVSDLAPIADLILKHHEWWNGQGYPLGLKGKEIPLECRILSIVDAYDAMTSERPYKKAMSHQEAVEELRRCSGTQFDPDLVEKFIVILDKDKHERKKLAFVNN